MVTATTSVESPASETEEENESDTDEKEKERSLKVIIRALRMRERSFWLGFDDGGCTAW